MLDAMAGTVVVAALVAAPLLWREWRDRREAEGLVVRAEVQHAVNRKLRGESLVSVRVRPRGVWRAGRVELLAPSGWETLIGEVWMPALARVPAGYELVMTARAPAAGTDRLAPAA